MQRIERQNFSNPSIPTCDAPKPKSSGPDFGQALAGVAAVAAPIAMNAVAPGSGSLLNSLSSMGTGSSLRIPGAGASEAQKNQFQLDLLRKQEEIQMRTLAFSTASNISKAQYDAANRTVQNIRVG